MLLLLAHPPVITIGQAGGEQDILLPRAALRRAGIEVAAADRGGRATYHGPGQLVAYPILRLDDGDLYEHVWRLEETAIRVLSTWGLAAERLERHPGVWVRGNKIAAVGVGARDGITHHGLALNLAPNLEHFALLIPCGIPDHGVTSIERELGSAPAMDEVARRFAAAFASVFGCRLVAGDRATLEAGGAAAAHPPWLWRRVTAGAEAAADRMAGLLAGLGLHTVCQEARCPNAAECFEQGTATFLILGNTCTRGCRFCAVSAGRPAPVDPAEPERVAEAAARLGLRHVVITSVTRDDLPDGGAGQFAAAVRALRRRLPGSTVEVLIPDLGGSCAALDTVLDVQPDVLNHNLETVPRLYAEVRPGAAYGRSLAVLARAKKQAPRVLSKSGLMLGLGERTAEVWRVLGDLRRAGCDAVTLGQYLQPGDRQRPVARYVPPEEFDWYRDRALLLGFRAVAAGPLVRSSHRAEALFREARGDA